jgi:hypothetical protein
MNDQEGIDWETQAGGMGAESFWMGLDNGMGQDKPWMHDELEMRSLIDDVESGGSIG